MTLNPLIQFDAAAGDLYLNNGVKVGPGYVATNLPIYANTDVHVAQALRFPYPEHVSELPPPAQNLGAVMIVSDALNPTWHGVLVGGGSTVCLAFCDGTKWVAL